MGYFRELPNLEYQSFLDDRTSSDQYLNVKNLFRRIKLRDDIQNIITIFDKYTIKDNSRPDTIAEEIYGRADLDWVVLLCAGIINVRNDWPLSDNDLYKFTLDKYGDDLTNIHHYETTEVLDKRGRLILPAGKIVDPTFTIEDPNDSQRIDPLIDPLDPYSKTVVNLNPVIGVTNYEYEVIENDKKRNIYVLKKSYLQQFLNDMREIMNYEPSSSFVNTRLIKTENTRNTIL
jgi:hypothetical protein